MKKRLSIYSLFLTVGDYNWKVLTWLIKLGEISNVNMIRLCVLLTAIKNRDMKKIIKASIIITLFQSCSYL